MRAFWVLLLLGIPWALGYRRDTDADTRQDVDSLLKGSSRSFWVNENLNWLSQKTKRPILTIERGFLQLVQRDWFDTKGPLTPKPFSDISQRLMRGGGGEGIREHATDLHVTPK